MARNQDRLKAKFLEALREHGIVLFACKKSGLARATYYRWVKEDEEFADQVNDALAEGTSNTTDMALFGLAYLIKEKDLGAIRFWLNNRSENFTFPRAIPQRQPTVYKPVQILSTIRAADGSLRKPKKKKDIDSL